MRAIASSAGRIPASWKKHGCMTVLMRLPIPASSATAKASIIQKSIALSISKRWTAPGRCSQTSSGPYGELSRNVAPCLAYSSTLVLASIPNWWQATKSASSTRYVERMASGPKRRCETVIEPDFLES